MLEPHLVALINHTGTDQNPEFESIAKEGDPTLLTDVLSQFDSCVSSLLSLASLEGIPEDQLHHFQSQYTQHAFRCRFIPCTASSLGFSTESLRDAHEKFHVKRLFCDKTNCLRSRVGFQRQRDLDQHNKAYHNVGSILVPPAVRGISAGASGSSNREVSLLREAESTPPYVLAPKWGAGRSAGTWKINKQRIRFGETLKNLGKFEEALDRLQISDLLQSEEGFDSGEGFDWGVLFNADERCVFDISLERVLQHKSIACCVSISRTGEYLATACNWTAQVFDLQTGELKNTLQHSPPDLQTGKLKDILQHSPPERGGNYVLSVSFSPDGMMLATGAEDKLVRV